MSFLSSKPIHLQKSKEYSTAPPKGQAHAVPVPGSAKIGRSAVYRHWRFKDGLVETLDDEVRTIHDGKALPHEVLLEYTDGTTVFEQTAKRLPHQPCLGHRPWNSTNKAWDRYTWIDYETVQQRRGAFGAGLVEIHAREGVTGKFGVGLWCQNRPEW